MKYFFTLLLSILFFNQELFGTGDKLKSKPVISMHLLNFTSDADLQILSAKIPELAEKGVNLLFLEVDYSYDFESHPELRSDKYITFPGARKFAQLCKKFNIRLVPEFQSLGHQSWSAWNGSLLARYPELDIAPGAFPGNKDIYCREWDPTNPKVNQIVFPLIDEIVNAFQADGIHVGMDEVFLLGCKESATTVGKDPAELFAKVVNEFHDHFVKKKKLEMFMWGDRLIDGNKYNYGSWEASTNGTFPAIDKIPHDIVICDWHYNLRESYPSISMFLEKGFKVIPCSYRNPLAAKLLIKHSLREDHPNMLGHMFTSWGSVSHDSITIYPAFVEGLNVLKNKKIWDVAINLQSTNADGTLLIELSCSKKDLKIFYTTDGSEPTDKSNSYSQPFKVDKSSVIKAIAYSGRFVAGEANQNSFSVHQATGKNVFLKTQASTKYQPKVGSLVNGIAATQSFSDGQWAGFEGQDIEAVIDLGTFKEISEVSLNCFNDPISWIMPAEKVEVWTSIDNVNFQKTGEAKVNQNQSGHAVAVTVSFEKVNVKFVKILIPKRMLPAEHQGAGMPAWIFIDELMVK
jgi:hypothetical protein